MTQSGRRHFVGLLVALSAAGCSTPKETAGTVAAGIRAWSGRLSVELETEPRQSFFAFFELRGAADAGDLILSGPLGNAIASIRWTRTEASLRVAETSRTFDSVETLIQTLTGAALPLGAVFAWLDGIDANTGGWMADLSKIGQGRLLARRSSPEPVVNLKLIVD